MLELIHSIFLIVNILIQIMCILYLLKIGINQDMFECYVEPEANLPSFYAEASTREERVQKLKDTKSIEGVVNFTA